MLLSLPPSPPPKYHLLTFFFFFFCTHIVEEIDTRRQQAVGKALQVVHDAIDALQADEVSCSLGCDTFLLGALIKSLRRNRLAWPRPSKPFLGVSIVEISRSVREAEAQLAQLTPSLWLGSPAAGGREKQRTLTRKRKTPNAQPGQALTPDSSPEPGATFDDEHECDARTNIAAKLGELESAVNGLELESKLGYYLY